MGKHNHLRCIHYEISITIQPELVHPAHKLYGGTISVDCVVTIKNDTEQEVAIIPFLLYRLLQIDCVENISGQELPFTQRIVRLKEQPRRQVNYVTVSLFTPLPPGASTKVHLKYQGPVCGYPEVFPYVRDHISSQYTLLRTDALWFPVVGEPVNGWPKGSFTFDLTAIVPHNLTVIANGQLCRRSEPPHAICYQWRSTKPDPWGHLTIACASFQQVVIAPKVSLFYLPDDHVGAQIVVKAVSRALELCTAWFGDLRLSTLNIVEIPEGYGSEASPNLILQTADAFKAGHPDDVRAYQQALSWVGHEVIHLWNTPSREKHISRFLDESITHYIEALLLREEFGDIAYWQRLESYRANFLSGGEPVMSVPLVEAGLHLQVRDAIARGKGPWLLSVLHRLMGDRLLTALRVFLDKYKTQGATLEDFQATMAQFANMELSRLFQEWLWGLESSKHLAQELEGQELVSKLVDQYARDAS